MKIENDPAIERLVTNRTVLEKIRPIEQKLKYRIDKAVKVADTGQVSAADPMNFKANPAALVSKLGDGDDDEEEETAAEQVDDRGSEEAAHGHARRDLPEGGRDAQETGARGPGEGPVRGGALHAAAVDQKGPEGVAQVALHRRQHRRRGHRSAPTTSALRRR